METHLDAPTAAVSDPGSRLWAAPLAVGTAVFLGGTFILLLARHPLYIVVLAVGFVLAILASLGCYALISQEVIVGSEGLTVRGPRDRAPPPVPWSNVVEVTYLRRLTGRGGQYHQIYLRRTNGALLVIGEFQVNSIYRVAKAIARFYPGDTTGGTPHFVDQSWWS